METLNDEYGLYRVGPRTYLNKYDAIHAALRWRQKIEFLWNTEFWKSQNWKLPSKKSLPQLYKERAERIRAKYDYIILAYSGGADSWNVLNTFDQNNIRLDEVVSYHDVGLTGTKESVLSDEIFKRAVPTMEDFRTRHPETIHTLIDSKIVLTDYYTKHSFDQSLETYFSHPGTFSHPLRRGYWFYLEPRFRQLVESGKRVAIVWGHDKCAVWYLHGRHVFWFNDQHVYDLRKRLYHPELPVHDELFYWDPDAAELLIKQCHVVKFELERATGPEKVEQTLINFHIMSRGGPISYKTLNTWLYPGWERETLSLVKPPQTAFFNHFDYHISERPNEEIVKKWKKLLEFGWKTYQKIDDHHRTPINSEFGKYSGNLFTEPYVL